METAVTTPPKSATKSAVKKGLDKNEGKKSVVTGKEAHSRELHAELSPAELKKRVLEDKKKVASTFKSKTDQDGAVAAALKTADGVKAMALAKTKGGRHTLKVGISGKWKCSVAYPYTRVDGKKDSFTSDGLVREVTVILDGKDGKVGIQTAYPSDFAFV